ncbi:MAG: sugar kinase [Acetobacteraceae bacterium]|nr:sugar kinase [Acetobacteraceae bacterium]
MPAETPLGPVLCIGECMIELSERPDGMITRAFGGDTLNTALYLARLGVPTDYVTALGHDAFSDEMLAAWQAEGIGISLVPRVKAALPGLYLIRTDAQGERSFHHWRDSAPVRRLFTLPEIGEIEAAFVKAGMIYVSGITLSLFDPSSRARLFAGLATARDCGVKIVFDTNFRARGWPDLALAREIYTAAFEASDLVLASVEDHAGVFGSDDADIVAARLQAANVAECVIKLASPACHVITPGARCFVQAAPVEHVLDTTAAGDSFAAAYMAARRSGCSPEDSARAGHRLAGTVVQHRGAIIPQAAMPAMSFPGESV